MNIGQLPGYYYDAEKKKYFKVQANHIAPSGAKYAKSNVRREQHETKKRKLNEKKTRKQAQQTVRRRPIVQDAFVSGIDLGRELGQHRTRRDRRDARDAALIGYLEPDTFPVIGPGPSMLQDLLPLPDGDSAWAQSTGFGSIVYWDSYPPEVGSPNKDVAIAFGSDVIGLHAIHPFGRPDRFESYIEPIVVVARDSHQPGNVFTGRRPHPSDDDHPGGMFLALGSPHSSLWSTAYRQDPKHMHLAVSGTSHIFVVDIDEFALAHCIAVPSESRAVTWFRHDTLAYGQGSAEIDYSLCLWDIRSSGTAERFRRSKPVTGIKAPNEDGIQLLVSDNTSLDLYDTRKTTDPLMSFRHVHEGPQLQFDINSLGEVAAVDRHNIIQVYSLSAGKAIGPLSQRGFGGERLHNLRWIFETEHPILQACQNWSVVDWKWSLDDEPVMEDYAPSGALPDNWDEYYGDAEMQDAT